MSNPTKVMLGLAGGLTTVKKAISLEQNVELTSNQVVNLSVHCLDVYLKINKYGP